MTDFITSEPPQPQIPGPLLASQSFHLRLVIADRMDLGPEEEGHECEEEALKAQEDDQNEGDRRGEASAFYLLATHTKR